MVERIGEGERLLGVFFANRVFLCFVCVMVSMGAGKLPSFRDGGNDLCSLGQRKQSHAGGVIRPWRLQVARGAREEYEASAGRVLVFEVRNLQGAERTCFSPPYKASNASERASKTSGRRCRTEEEGTRAVTGLKPGCPLCTDAHMRRAGGVLQQRGVEEERKIG